MSKYIKSFTTVPKTLFRTNNGLLVSLRDRAVKSKGSYDLLTEAGKVQPKALDPNTHKAPNGASMRPNTIFQTKLVKNSQGSNVMIFALAPGTPIPADLILVHEFRDHYSLQAAKEMSLAELNAKITAFLTQSGERLTKDEWLAKYPKLTEAS